MNSGRLSELVNSLNEISGMEAHVCNNYSRTICCSKSRLPLCTFVHSAEGMRTLCRESDIGRIADMRERGEPVFYTCPFGVFEMLLPIQSRGTDRGFLFCSIGIDSDREEEYIVKVAELTGISLSVVDSVYRQMPHFTKGQLDAYTRLLPIVAEKIGNDELITRDGESLGLLAKHYVMDNLSKKITLSEMSRYFHCSTVTLTESFKREFGISIMQYTMKKRMQVAREMLINSDKLIKEIAVSVGFSDVEYFSRCYRDFWKKTPSEYRNSMKRCYGK